MWPVLPAVSSPRVLPYSTKDARRTSGLCVFREMDPLVTPIKEAGSVFSIFPQPVSHPNTSPHRPVIPRFISNLCVCGERHPLVPPIKKMAKLACSDFAQPASTFHKWPRSPCFPLLHFRFVFAESKILHSFIKQPVMPAASSFSLLSSLTIDPEPPVVHHCISGLCVCRKRDPQVFPSNVASAV